MSSISFRNPKLNLGLSCVFFAASIILVLYYYRLGGTRDFGLYVNAGRAFMNGENAYETQLWRSGSFGTTIIWLISLPIPSSLEPLIFQFLSLAGFFVFANSLGLIKEKRYWTYGFILFLSPVREVINTIQITGVVIGLLAISLLELGPKSMLTPTTHRILQGTALAIALDLKAHSVIFVVLLLLMKKLKRGVIFWAFGICVSGHAVVNLINGNFLEVFWFRNLMNLGNASGENGESTSIWRLIDYLSAGHVNTSVISILLIVCLLLIVGLYGSSFSLSGLVLSGLIASSFMTYMHYYDLAPLAVFTLVVFSKNSKSILGLACIMFMILPREFDSNRNLFTLILLTFLIVYFFDAKRSRLTNTLISIGLATSAFSGLHLINYVVGFDYRLGHALVTTQTMVLIICFTIIKLKLIQGLEFGQENRAKREMSE
jgi:hypothetical protein